MVASRICGLFGGIVCVASGSSDIYSAERSHVRERGVWLHYSSPCHHRGVRLNSLLGMICLVLVPPVIRLLQQQRRADEKSEKHTWTLNITASELQV